MSFIRNDQPLAMLIGIYFIGWFGSSPSVFMIVSLLFLFFILCFIIIPISWNCLILFTLELMSYLFKMLILLYNSPNCLLALSNSFLAFIFSLVVASLDFQRVFFFLLNSSIASGKLLSFKYSKIDFIVSSVYFRILIDIYIISFYLSYVSRSYFISVYIR